MRAHIKTSLILSFLLSFLLICLPQSHVNAQDFLKKFLSNSSIKSGKQLKSDGDYPSAITKFTKSIKRNPENLEAYYQLGLILEEVLRDYDKAISLYKNVISLSSGVKPLGTDEELKEFNSLIINTRKSIDRAIGQKFESIKKSKVPVYIMVEPYKKILKEPKMFSFSIHKTTSFATEFRLLDFSGNWYQINVPNTGQEWVNGKNVLKIIQKGKNAIETSPTGKEALYQRFVDQYPDSRFAQNAKDRADNMYYSFANEEGTINSYSMYLRKYLDEYPDGKYVTDAIRRIDEKKFSSLLNSQDIEFLTEHLKNEASEGRVELVKNRIEELYFKKAEKANNDAEAIKIYEEYLQKYPAGTYVQEVKTRIEVLSFNIAAKTNTKEAYHDFIKKYP